ncbi:Rossmann fold nucleotide-binding protein Smf possibly involved in DNA uptake [hydrothermal vent metagenome]|uniref:Rossmann fold nucleotide-binding protein Smf possibly involved in DNA uptake n=1 Tax=hydrothermal vent metagenome TaxID=652676 RepID=A0A3B0Y696_9ZZZZ
MDALSMDELQTRLRLIRCNLPPRTLFKLLDHFSATETIFTAAAAKLETLGLKNAQIERIQAYNASDISRDLAWLDGNNHGILFFDNPAYPQQLLEIYDPPYALFYIGDIDYLQQPQLAMVGSRSPTASGQKTAERFAQHLSNAGITITSGLAHGIDTVSHLGALKGIGGSVAVVANGLHTIYPRTNIRLAEAISQHGCIVTESTVGIAPQKGLFPRRNRIISGLSIGTLVTEAAINSGSLITTRHAMEQGREVFAIPGSIHNPLAKGCHKLIKSGARLVETAEDILEELFPLVNSSSISHTSAPETDFKPQAGTQQTDTVCENIPAISANNTKEALDPGYQTLLKHMEFEPTGIDELVERSNLGASEIASMLLILELQGEVISQNGLYSRTTDGLPPTTM